MKRFVFRLATVVVTAGVMVLPSMAQSTDQGFITKAMESNYAEVRLGCLAESKAQSPQVQDFARMMVTDHSQAIQRMHSIMGASTTGDMNADTTENTNNTATDNSANANEICQTIATSQTTQNNPWNNVQLTPKDQALYDRLSKVSGANFDREYINAMVDDHKKDVREFEQEAGVSSNTNNSAELNRQKPGTENTESDAQAREVARELLPTLQKHLQAAETIQHQLQR